jgi:L-rhamnose mutarotase
MKKYCIVIEIKPEYAEEYVRIHNHPWQEMLEAIREAGFTNEVIYYYKNQSIIFLECEDYEACNATLRASEICKKWDVTVCPWFAADPAMPPKIFDLNQQLEGVLLPD